MYAAIGLGSLAITLAIIGLLSVQEMKTTVKTPDGREVPMVEMVDETYNAAAEAAGRAAVAAQRIKFAMDNEYARNVAELRAIDKSVGTDPGIIFIFGEPGDKGYSFTTSHVKGNRTYVFP
jgi:hypothetical protein